MSEIVYKQESFEIMGACFEVYNEMGCGFLEPVYQECMELELVQRNIPVVSQQQLQLTYKGQTLRSTYIPDFICYGKIILEIKAIADLADQHRAQVHNYLKATKYRLGLLVNFGNHPKLQ